MKNEQNRSLGKGVRDLCAEAISWCGKLEARSAGLPAALGRTFASLLGAAKPAFDFRSLALILINAIRQLIERLLADETLHVEALDGLPPARGRRDAALKELFRKLKVFRQLGLSNRRGPVVPPGRLPRQPDALATVAAAVRSQLDCPDLQAAPGVRILPTLVPEFDQAAAELAAATADVEDAQDRVRETRAARDATIAELGRRVTSARSLHQAVRDLGALDPGK